MSLHPGQDVSHYRLVEKIGEGGMGVVWKAEDRRLGRSVALKLLPEGASASPQAAERFEREARAASALNHPNICTLHDIGEWEGRRFIVLELLEGQPLHRKLAARIFEIDTAVGLATQIADALDTAHRRGILHRDIKAANLFVTAGGQIKILDFGLAKLSPAVGPEALSAAETVAFERELTSPGATAGTIAYMSPEQASGRELDARTDIFSLGVVLYEMVTGCHPFARGSLAATCLSIMNEAPTPTRQLNPAVPVELERIIGKSLEKDRDLRYQSAAEVRADLKRLTRDSASGVRDLPERSPAAEARSPSWPWWLLGALALAGLGAAALVLWLREPPAPVESWRIRGLTSFVGATEHPGWSPDASFIAYVRTLAGNFDVFVMPTAGGEAVRLTETPADEYFPRWSPDGAHIAYTSSRGASTLIFLNSPLGGSERLLADTGLHFMDDIGVIGEGVLGSQPWSPDGSELLFTRRTPAGTGIWKVHVTTGQETQVVSPPADGYDTNATWSFDGRRIAFRRLAGGSASLHVIEPGGGSPEVLPSGPADPSAPAWTSDSRRIVFVSSSGNQGHLREIDLETRRVRQLTTGSGDLWPVVARNGQLAYEQFSHQIDLYRLDVARGEEERLTYHRLDNYAPSISPDGGLIAYHSDRTGNNEIWVLDPETRKERQITRHEAEDYNPRWSGDGSRLVFQSEREGGSPIWVVNADGSGLRPLVESDALEGAYLAKWSPDGTLIGCLKGGEKGPGLWVVGPDGGTPRSVLAGAQRFDWYRGRDQVVYSTLESEVRVADLETGEEVTLYRGPHAHLEAAPDGSRICFVHAASHMDQQVFMLELEPPRPPGRLPRPKGEPIKLTSGGGAWHVHECTWSPDGRSIVYSRDADQVDIYVIENFK